jgi:hypothetical protein
VTEVAEAHAGGVSGGWQSERDVWYSESEVRYRDIPRPQPLIPDLLYLGTAAILAAGPKVGKSFLAQQWEHNLAFGRPFGGWPERDPVNCLIIDLEGDAGITQDRSRSISPLGVLPGEDRWGTGRARHRIWYAHSWPTDHGTFHERVELLDKELVRAVQEERPYGYVRIDTMRLFIGKNKKGENAYDFDASNMAALNKLAARHNVSMLMLHHLKKDGGEEDWVERLSGSMGSSASASTIMYLERARGAETGVLHMVSRRGMSADHPMKYDVHSGLWEFAPDLSVSEATHTSTPRLILEYLAKHPSATIGELRADIPATPTTIDRALQRLRQEGAIDYASKLWTLTNSPANRRRTDEPVPESLPWADRPEPVAPVAPAPTPTAPAGFEGAVSIPHQRSPVEDGFTPEPVPEMAGGNSAIQQLMEITKTSRLHAVWKLPPEQKDQLAYDAVWLGGKPNQYTFFPSRAPECAAVKVFDRKAAYPQSMKAWIVPNVLRRLGPMDYAEIRKERLAGMFMVVAQQWRHEGAFPNPWGQLRGGETALVPRATLDRMAQLAERGLIDPPRVLWSLAGHGSENLLAPWGQWMLDQRRTATDAEQLATRKAEQNVAFGSLRIVDPDKRPGAVDRPDWQYGVIGAHYAAMNRIAVTALDAGEQLLAVGNTDELAFGVPDDQDPETWVPESMRAHLEKNRFAVKYVRPAAEWFDDPRRTARG